jgi:CRISPR-associated protein Cmr5
MKNIEKILPSAIKAVEDKVISKNEVPKEFNGYISSFGASVIMSGLLPTLVFFSQEGKSKGNRKSVIEAIEQILNAEYSGLLSSNRKLLNTVKDNLSNRAKIERLQEKILEAGIALKLAIRIFPKAKKESNHE